MGEPDEVTSPVLDVRGVDYRYPDGTEALIGIDLEVGRGERIAVLGPNGAGKTTLALHLNGTLRASRGTISVDGLKLADEHLTEIRRRVGMVFQDADAQLFMPTVGDDVAFGPANLGHDRDEIERRVIAALVAVGAESLRDRNPYHLSTGEKRRVALATVLSMEPSILVLDEPTAGLDPAGRRELIALLDTQPLAQLIVTHDLLFALDVCARSVVVDCGRIVAEGPTNELLANEALLQQHRLELPRGVNPKALGIAHP